MNLKRRELSQLNIKSLKHLSLLINEPLALLLEIADNIDIYYAPFEIPKKHVGTRPIDNPLQPLKRIQWKINRHLLARIKLPEVIHGSRKSHSIITNAKPHMRKAMVVTIDIKDFFPNLDYGKIYRLYIDLGCSYNVASLLTRLTTWKYRIPQGALTSSTLANLYLHKSGVVDAFIGFCRKRNYQVGFYVDDIAISGDETVRKYKNVYRKIIRQAGLDINPKKIHVMSRRSHQEVTGIVVNRKLNKPKDYVRNIRVMLHKLEKGLPLAEMPKQVQGKIKHLEYVNPELGKRYLNRFLSINPK